MTRCALFVHEHLKCVLYAPNGVLCAQFNKYRVQVEVQNAEAYAFDDEPLIKATDMKFPDLLTIKPQRNRFIFKVESTGALHAYNIVLLGFQVLIDKLAKIKCDN